MTSEEILFDAEERMEKAIGKLKSDLTGNATSSTITYAGKTCHV